MSEKNDALLIMFFFLKQALYYLVIFINVIFLKQFDFKSFLV